MLDRVPEDALRVVRVLNLGGGVQSSALALMLYYGYIDAPLPDVMIHADTQSDPPEVMEMVHYLADMVDWPTIITKAGGGVAHDVSKGLNSDGDFGLTIPVHILKEKGKHALGRRFCTSNYKVRPIDKSIRKYLGIAHGKHMPKGWYVEHYYGISTDEAGRMRNARKPWARNTYPLIEADLSRQDCKDFWKEFAPDDAPELSRSACYICPYKTRPEWRDLATRHPDLLEKAIKVEKQMQAHEAYRSEYKVFLHRRRIPLEEAIKKDFEEVEMEGEEYDSFGEECEGMCGV